MSNQTLVKATISIKGIKDKDKVYVNRNAIVGIRITPTEEFMLNITDENLKAISKSFGEKEIVSITVDDATLKSLTS